MSTAQVMSPNVETYTVAFLRIENEIDFFKLFEGMYSPHPLLPKNGFSPYDDTRDYPALYSPHKWDNHSIRLRLHRSSYHGSLMLILAKYLRARNALLDIFSRYRDEDTFLKVFAHCVKEVKGGTTYQALVWSSEFREVFLMERNPFEVGVDATVRFTVVAGSNAVTRKIIADKIITAANPIIGTVSANISDNGCADDMTAFLMQKSTL